MSVSASADTRLMKARMIRKYFRQHSWHKNVNELLLLKHIRKQSATAFLSQMSEFLRLGGFEVAEASHADTPLSH